MAVRIPVLDGPSVQERALPTPYSNQNFDTGLGDVGKQLAGVGQAAQQVEDAYSAVREKANALAANDALTRYQHDITTALDGNAEGAPSQAAPSGATPGDTQAQLDKAWEAGDQDPLQGKGFLSTRGMDAGKQSAATLEWLDSRRQSIAENLSNDAQRRVFMQHAGGLFESTRARVETHTRSQAQVAEDASLQGRMAVTLQQVASNYTDEDGSASIAAKQVESAIRAFNLPYGQDVADAKVQAWREKVAETRLNEYLGAKDWQGAETALGVLKDSLPAQVARKFERDIGIYRRDDIADKSAQSLAQAFTKGDEEHPDGRIDLDGALAALRESDVKDPAVRKAMEHRLLELSHERDLAWDQRTKQVSSEAFSAFNAGGERFSAIPGPLRDELNTRNPELFYRLSEDAKRQQHQSRLSRAEQDKAQREIDTYERERFLAQPTKEQANTDLDTWLAGTGVSPAMKQTIAKHRRVASESVERGEATTQDEFVGRAEKSAAVRNNTEKARIRSEATVAFQDFQVRRKRPPSDEEGAKLISGLVAKVKEEHWYGDKDVPAYDYLAKQREKGITNPALPGQQPAVPPAGTAGAPGTPPAAGAPAPKAAPHTPVGQRYLELKRAGKTPAEIAKTLDAEGYPPPGKGAR